MVIAKKGRSYERGRSDFARAFFASTETSKQKRGGSRPPFLYRLKFSVLLYDLSDIGIQPSVRNNRCSHCTYHCGGLGDHLREHSYIQLPTLRQNRSAVSTGEIAGDSGVIQRNGCSATSNGRCSEKLGKRFSTGQIRVKSLTQRVCQRIIRDDLISVYL